LGMLYLYGQGVEKSMLTGYQHVLSASLQIGLKSIDSRDLVSSALTAEQIADIQEETRNWQLKT